MPELIATRDFKYRTRRLMAGDTFDARTDLDAKILTSVRRVAAVPLAKVTETVTPTAEEMPVVEVVEEAAAVEAPAEKPKPHKKAAKPRARR